MKYVLHILLSVSAVSAQPVVVWTKPDGAVRITHPAWSEQRSNETTAAFMVRVRNRTQVTVPALSDAVPSIMDLSDIPQDRYFRDAWKLQAGVIRPDRARAETIHRKRMRGRIRAAMQRGDVSIQRAIDLEASVDAMNLTTPATIQDLKAAEPAQLRGLGE